MYKKSEGLNDSEKILSELGDKSFLKLWSYPNLFRSPGTELCDLLVVFENKVLIFSDKECLFQKEKEEVIAWSRWKKRAVDNSIKSVIGTERWIRKCPKKVYMDSKCETPFPFDLSQEKIIFIKFIVANGSPYDLEIKYDDEKSNDIIKPYSLTLNNKNIIHVLSDHNLKSILDELDTVSDFCEYFLEKESLIHEKKSLSYYSESDLLAHYFLKIDDREDYHKILFQKSEDGKEVITQGAWERYSTELQYKLKKDKDQNSYIWDELIQYLASNTLDGTLEYSNSDPYTGQSAIHIMAIENRLSRRILGGGIFDAIDEYVPELGTRFSRLMLSSKSNVLYVFLLVTSHKIEELNSTNYLNARREMLEIACVSLKIKIFEENHERFKDVTQIVGIATASPKISKKVNSQDFLLFNFENSDPNYEKNIMLANKDIGFWKKTNLDNIIEQTEDEFPKLDIENLKNIEDIDSLIVFDDDYIIFSKK